MVLKRNASGALIRNAFTGALCTTCCSPDDLCYQWEGSYTLTSDGVSWNFDLAKGNSSPVPGYISVPGYPSWIIPHPYDRGGGVPAIDYVDPGWTMGFGRGCLESGFCTVRLEFNVRAKEYYETSYVTVNAWYEFRSPSFGGPFTLYDKGDRYVVTPEYYASLPDYRKYFILAVWGPDPTVVLS